MQVKHRFKILALVVAVAFVSVLGVYRFVYAQDGESTRYHNSQFQHRKWRGDNDRGIFKNVIDRDAVKGAIAGALGMTTEELEAAKEARANSGADCRREGR